MLEAEFARLKPEGVGERIGPYKLLQNIGEGGFGVVWMADQERPVRRRVALKIIKLGMDTKEVIARFEQERQALAMMDHPNIAKVFDAGATQWGRPYFVMELVRGTRITDYCDEARLPTADRLQLFIQVCHAVQHAHQKGIIHRDIKPSNILVTLHDGVPVPKVIDFGVAKATQSQRLTDLTLFTQFQQMVGTPLYMSPEQAEMSGLDIDTRTDIYSLGVLLYELLTGRTPFNPADLMRKGHDEIRRTIREQEPQKPSAVLHGMESTRRMRGPFRMRMGSTGNPPSGSQCAPDLQHPANLAEPALPRSAGPVASQRGQVARATREHGADAFHATTPRRHTDLGKLASELRGDLDSIVMKALEKDRARRYETANELALDIQRHLASEPVLARPPSQLYRFRRMVRRNWLAVAAAGAVAVALLVAVIILAASSVRIIAEKNQKEAALQEKESARAAEHTERQKSDAANRALHDANVQMADTVSLLELERAENLFLAGDTGLGVA
ncbi:MAG: serine/threonine-protein kinase, partial [Chthoniobacteraceae bacterium]